MRLHLLIIAILIVTLCNTTVDAQTAQLPKFLVGTWKVQGKTTYETWELSKDKKRLVGQSYKLVDGKQKLLEKLSIEVVNHQLTYKAQVLNQNDGQVIAFKRNKQRKGQWSFENLEHDFPKRIAYRKLNPDKLSVRVESDASKGFDLILLKVKPISESGNSSRVSRSEDSNPPS